MRRTKEEAEGTRKKLLKTGLKVFREKSYAATRLSDIAKAAGVTRGAIYHHFGSKSEMFKAIAIEHRDMFTKLFEDLNRNENDNPVDALKKMVSSIFEKLDNDKYFRYFMEIMAKTDMKKEIPEIAEIFGNNKFEGHNNLVTMIERGKEKGLIRKDLDTSLFAFFIISSLFGIMTVWLDKKNNIKIKDESEKLVGFIFSAVR